MTRLRWCTILLMTNEYGRYAVLIIDKSIIDFIISTVFVYKTTDDFSMSGL